MAKIAATYSPSALALAQAIVKFAEAREASYDQVAAGAAKAEADKRKAADPDNLYAGLVDYSQFYVPVSLQELAEKMEAEGNLPMGLALPVYFLVDEGFGETFEWAADVIAGLKWVPDPESEEDDDDAPKVAKAV